MPINMESLRRDQDNFYRSFDASLEKSLDGVQNSIDLLVNARDAIVQSPSKASVVMAKLQPPIRGSFNATKGNLADMHKGLTNYSKALDKKFKDKTVPADDPDALADKQGLIDRAIGMHFLREGQFAVAQAFLNEAQADAPLPSLATSPGPPPSIDPTPHDAQQDAAMHDAAAVPTRPNTPDDPSSPLAAAAAAAAASADAAAAAADTSLRSEFLRRQFQSMYHILDEMTHRRNLAPAMAWARAHGPALEARGSNLEFELHGLRFVWLLEHGDATPPEASPARSGAHPPTSPSRVPSPPLAPSLHARRAAALAYAQREFPAFRPRYAREIERLATALAFAPNLAGSPYSALARHSAAAWADLAAAFTREFCSRLGLAAAPPLAVAAAAGAVALPTLGKLRGIMRAKRTEWTTAHELPVEIPLPPAYRFHAIFVCPVSKEQTTDANPPMMLPCGHVVARESLHRLARTGRFKCPYCPGESQPKDARRVYL